MSLKDLYKLDELAEQKGVTDLTDDSDPKKTWKYKIFFPFLIFMMILSWVISSSPAETFIGTEELEV